MKMKKLIILLVVPVYIGVLISAEFLTDVMPPKWYGEPTWASYDTT
jgi:hypothetical protein